MPSSLVSRMSMALSYDRDAEAEGGVALVVGEQALPVAVEALDVEVDVQVAAEAFVQGVGQVDLDAALVPVVAEAGEDGAFEPLAPADGGAEVAVAAVVF